MSQIAESHDQYAIYTAGLGHSAFLLQEDPPHSVWVGFLSGPLCRKSLTTVSHLARLMSRSLPSTLLEGFLPPRCQPKPHPGPCLAIITFPSDCALSPWVLDVCSGVVNPGEPRNQTLLLQRMIVASTQPSHLHITELITLN